MGRPRYDHPNNLPGLAPKPSKWYNANGNLIYRLVDGARQILCYGAENRLTGVSGAAAATFVYDGDGNRVKGTVNGTSTTYTGNYFEWTGSARVRFRGKSGRGMAFRNQPLGVNLFFLL
jgi:YD repeat-containing protein